MVLSFAEQLICSESKKPEGDWESDILDQITVTRVVTVDSCIDGFHLTSSLSKI